MDGIDQFRLTGFCFGEQPLQLNGSVVIPYNPQGLDGRQLDLLIVVMKQRNQYITALVSV